MPWRSDDYEADILGITAQHKVKHAQDSMSAAVLRLSGQDGGFDVKYPDWTDSRYANKCYATYQVPMQIQFHPRL